MTENATTPAPSEPVAGPVQRKLGQAAEARWYCLSRDGLATLCRDEADARATAAESGELYPHLGPYRAAQMVDAQDTEAVRHLLQHALAALENFEHYRSIMVDGPDVSDKLLAEDYAEIGFVQGATLLPALRAALKA